LAFIHAICGEKNLISVLQLGTLDYVTGLRLQQKLVELCKENRIGDVLLQLEHTPVITLGRNAKTANVIASSELLSERGVELFECDRGGDVTFHGPGQLVGYPIFDLRGFESTQSNRKTLGVIEYVRRIEEVLIRTCADFGIATGRVAGLTGVWTGEEHVGTAASGCAAERSSAWTGEDARPYTQSKVAAIGVHISRGVTSHGFALNVNTDLSFFNLIIPCGISSKPVTSMEKELNKTIPLQEVAHSISRNFGAVFQSQMLWLDTLDDLLGQALGVPLKTPEELRKILGEQETFRA
jgi:lipoyl(octanoyl) transferase